MAMTANSGSGLEITPKGATDQLRVPPLSILEPVSNQVPPTMSAPLAARPAAEGHAGPGAGEGGGSEVGWGGERRAAQREGGGEPDCRAPANLGGCPAAIKESPGG